MELACVVSPVESFEDINNNNPSPIHRQDQEKETNPHTVLGEVVW